jgi:peptidoglycan/xylan/chitin deacetylase (PgdA/CDA1 family)
VSLFERQLQWLSQFAEFVTLDDLLETPNSNQWRVAITFDDGYRDNIELGLPIFQRYEVPVTWFICTQFVEESDYLPWWDLVEYMTEQVRGMVEMTIASEDRAYKLNSTDERDRFRKDMREAFRSADSSSREALYENLRAECSRFASLPPNAFANRTYITQAASSPWIFIGGHTASHPNLAKVGPERLEYEVRKGRKQLQEWTGEPVDWFAYPYGGKSTHNAEVRRILNKAGFRGAVTTARGYIADDPDPFELPRFMVPAWAGMIGFKAGVLGLNQADWLARKADWSIRWSRKLLRSL